MKRSYNHLLAGRISSFFRISGAPIICSPWLRYIWYFGRTESDGVYARADWAKPSRGRFGLLQTVADVLKLLLKEDSIPKAADKPLFILAPVIAFAPAFMVLAVIPFTDKFQFADIGVGLLYYIAVSGITTIGVVTGGWASNNKYSLLGGMRAAAQMISYEIPLVMSVIGIVLLAGSLNLNEIVAAQENVWYIFVQPIGFVVFLIAAVAELNRTPFDLPEAESELVSGYHTEYSGFRWAFFMLSEYVYFFGMASLITVFFRRMESSYVPWIHPRCRMVCFKV